MHCLPLMTNTTVFFCVHILSENDNKVNLESWTSIVFTPKTLKWAKESSVQCGPVHWQLFTVLWQNLSYMDKLSIVATSNIVYIFRPGYTEGVSHPSPTFQPPHPSHLSRTVFCAHPKNSVSHFIHVFSYFNVIYPCIKPLKKIKRQNFKHQNQNEAYQDLQWITKTTIFIFKKNNQTKTKNVYFFNLKILWLQNIF